ncbi:MAG: hypothetical protein MZW92_45735 [Comamonadaceae bacterium]|nr:hypothetical protein [Comamonadaceae bacterium]
MNLRHQRLLFELLSLPTAPFREQHVLDFATRLLDRARVPHFTDPAGNLVIGVDSASGYRSLLRRDRCEPVRLFIAHADHPGFHGRRWLSDRRLEIQWHGGSPVRHLNGARVWIADAGGYMADGCMVRTRLLPSRHAIDTAEVVLASPLPAARPADALFGGFRFRAPVWRSKAHSYQGGRRPGRRVRGAGDRARPVPRAAPDRAAIPRPADPRRGSRIRRCARPFRAGVG